MSNEWRSVDADKWRDVVRRVVDIYNSKHLEEWEVMGQIAYEFEKVVAKNDAEIERLKAQNKVFRNAQKCCETCDAPTVARIAFLEKALEQAVDAGSLHIAPVAEGDKAYGFHRYVGQTLILGISATELFYGGHPDDSPELAAYLRERDNRPPSDVVQNVVQDAGEGGGTDV